MNSSSRPTTPSISSRLVRILRRRAVTDPAERGPGLERVLRRDLGRHRILAEIALVVAWVSISGVVVFAFTTSARPRSVAGFTLGWLFVALSGAMVIVILAFGRLAGVRIREGLVDAAQLLRSTELVTDPELSFLPLDMLLDELLARTTQVMGGDMAALLLVTSDGRHMTVRAAHGFQELGDAGTQVEVGQGLLGRVAANAEAIIVNDVAGSHLASPMLRGRVASLVAAPLLVRGEVIGVVQVGAREIDRFQVRDLRLMQLVADRCGASIEHGRLDEAERRSRLGAEHARLHLALLARAGDVLATALESYNEALAELAGVVVPDFADWFAVDITEDGGELHRVVHASRGGSRTKVETSPVAHRHPQGDRLVLRAMAQGRPEVVMTTKRMGSPHGGEPAFPGDYGEGAPASGVESMIIVPIRVRGLSFGALSFVTGSGRRGYRRSDLETAQGLAERVGVAVERVLSWGTSRAAEHTATRYAERLQRLMEAALVVNAPLADSEVLRVLADHAQRVLEARQVVVSALPSGGPIAETVWPPDALGSEIDVDVVTLASRLVAESNRPRRWPESIPHPASAKRAKQSAPWLAVPLTDNEGHCQRAIVVLGHDRDLFTNEDESVLTLLAEMASVALKNAHLYQAVEGNEHRLRTVVDSSPLAIAELDLAGEARWWNRAAEALFGWETDTPDRKVIPARQDGWPVLADLWERTRAGSPTLGTEVNADGRVGELLELSVSTAPLTDHRGNVAGILMVAEDVTERRRLMEQFNQAERLGAMARMAGGVAHDFNNLLTVILGCSEVLLRRMQDEDPAREDIAAIQRAGQRAAALTSQLLAIGHRRPLQPVVLDIDAVVTAMEPMLVRVLGEDVALELIPSQSVAHILADPAELERALLNLAINARDAMPSGGRFTFHTRVVGEDHEAGRPLVALAVTDTGTGMDADTVEHCFEPFFTTKGLAQGTGLGLATVHAAVNQAGGDVSVESTLGQGTTFTLWFPAEQGDVVALTPLMSGPTSGDEVILLVEDEEELGRLAVRELEDRGYTVIAASSGPEALSTAMARHDQVDLLVTDVVMPGMSGIELAALLTELYPGLPVLYVSGHLDAGAVGRHPLPDAADLLAKPFTPNQLALRVRDALDRASRATTAPVSARARRRA